MKNKNSIAYALAWSLVVLLVMGSCIRDKYEPCYGLTATIEIKDRNYANIDKVWGYADKVPDDKPFAAIIQSMYCVLVNTATNESTFTSIVTDASAEDLDYKLTYPIDMEFGTYLLTVWAGDNISEAVVDNGTALDFTKATGDVYLSQQLIDYQGYNTNCNLQLERLTGLVVAETNWKKTPNSLDMAELSCKNVAAKVSDDKVYSGTATISGSVAMKSGSKVISEITMSPSVDPKGALLSISYQNLTDKLKWIFAPDVKVKIAPNHVSVVKYDCDPLKRTFTVSVMNDDEQWEEVTTQQVSSEIEAMWNIIFGIGLD